MSARWSPESHVHTDSDGMVIEIKLSGLSAHALLTLMVTFEKKVLSISGKHEDFGKFESRFAIPLNHNPIEAKLNLETGVLRIKVPSGTGQKEIMLGPIPVPINFAGILPKPGKISAKIWGSAMMIYCKGCGKHFDITVGKGAQEYPCPHCGKMQLFDLESLINHAISQSSKMLRRKRGSR